jgi:hypothetical protein
MVYNIVKKLEEYRDKSYILSNLSYESAKYYFYFKNIFHIPLIIVYMTMSILNIIRIDYITLNYSNIITNISIIFILILINKYKIHEKYINYNNLYIKYTKLTHIVEDKLANEIDNCTIEDVKYIKKKYDSIYEYQKFNYPQILTKKIRKKYINSKRTLPYILYKDIDYKNINLLDPTEI